VNFNECGNRVSLLRWEIDERERFRIRGGGRAHFTHRNANCVCPLCASINSSRNPSVRIRTRVSFSSRDACRSKSLSGRRLTFCVFPLAGALIDSCCFFPRRRAADWQLLSSAATMRAESYSHMSQRCSERATAWKNTFAWVENGAVRFSTHSLFYDATLIFAQRAQQHIFITQLLCAQQCGSHWAFASRNRGEKYFKLLYSILLLNFLLRCSFCIVLLLLWNFIPVEALCF
jgi:hypothetical protein